VKLRPILHQRRGGCRPAPAAGGGRIAGLRAVLAV